MQPLVTAAILTYQRPAMLVRAISAILSQTFTDFELLVVDNASDDNTFDTVRQFSDPRLTYVRRSSNGGPEANYHEALVRARGEFILLTHDDDIAHPDLIAREVEALREHPTSVLVGTNVRLIDMDERPLRDSLYPGRNDRLFQPGELLGAWLNEGFWLPTPTLMMRRRAKLTDLRTQMMNPAQDLGNPRGIAGDTYAAIRLSRFGPVIWLSDPLLDYRQHETQSNMSMDSITCQGTFYRDLERLCRHSSMLRPWLSRVKALSIRYQVQELLLGMTHHGSDNETNIVPLARRIPMDCRGTLAALQTALATYLVNGYDNIINHIINGNIENSEITHAVHLWLMHSIQGKRTLGSEMRTRGVRRIVIQGSLLNAALLALDCMRSGLEVVGFIDSSTWRQGKSLLGRPIFETHQLSEVEGDLLLFSSEKRSHEELNKYWTRFLAANERLSSSCCWLELASGTWRPLPLEKNQ